MTDMLKMLEFGDSNPAATTAAAISTTANGRSRSSRATASNRGIAAHDRGLRQQLAAGAGGRVEESGGARKGRIVDSSTFFVGETLAKLESFSGVAR